MVKPIPRSLFPNLVTVANIFLGFYAIVNAFNGEMMTAFWCIIGGAVADIIDGKVARLVKGFSEFGVQYDSLADVITFGAAPSMIMYNLIGEGNTAGTIASFMPLLFGSLRLARFNVQLSGFDKAEFIGYPIPAAALTMISIIPLNTYLIDLQLIQQPLWTEYPLGLMMFVFCVSLLMVSTFRYQTMPVFRRTGERENFVKIVALAITVPLIILKTHLMLFVIMVFFSLQGIFRYLFTRQPKPVEGQDEK